MRAALIFAGVLVLLYLLILAALFVFQRRVLYLADNTKPDLERVGIAGLRSLTVTTADGLVLVAWYLPPVRADGLVVLFLHGNAGNIGHRAYRQGCCGRGGGRFSPAIWAEGSTAWTACGHTTGRSHRRGWP